MERDQMPETNPDNQELLREIASLRDEVSELTDEVRKLKNQIAGLELRVGEMDPEPEPPVPGF